jgi:hypothetical protein
VATDLNSILPSLINKRVARILAKPNLNTMSQLLDHLRSLYPEDGEVVIIDAGGLRPHEMMLDGVWTLDIALAISRARVIVFDSPSVNGVDDVHRLVLRTITDNYVRSSSIEDDSYADHPLGDDVRFIVVDFRGAYGEPTDLDRAGLPTYELD